MLGRKWLTKGAREVARKTRSHPAQLAQHKRVRIVWIRWSSTESRQQSSVAYARNRCRGPTTASLAPKRAATHGEHLGCTAATDCATMPFGKSKTPVIDPDEWYGKSFGETFGNRHFQLQLVAMIALHAALYYYFKGNPKSAFHANPNKMGHYVPFLIAFQFMAVYGSYIWLTDPDFHKIDATWSYHPGAETILFSMLAIQSYDTPISLCIPELRQITFVLHHAVVLSLSILSLRYRAFYYYAVYFLGVIELSSFTFLAVVGAAGTPKNRRKRYPVTNEICRVMFAIVFYIAENLRLVPRVVLLLAGCLLTVQ